MLEANRIQLTFLPGTQEEDAFAYLDDVRLAIRDIRLAGVRSIKQGPIAEVDITGWDSAIKTYSILLETSTVSILKASAATWLQAKAGRSLSIQLGDALAVHETVDEVAAWLDAALARVTSRN